MNDMTKPPESDRPANFPALLKTYATEIARALPKHMDGDRMARIALTEFRKNPKLAECEPRSVFAAVIVASQLGLEPGVLGQAYLVPYKVSKKVNGQWHEHFECQLIPGWQGYADLVARAGRAAVWTGAVFKGDEFEYAQGDRPFITHKRGDEEESEANLTHVYAVGRIKGSDWPVIEVWSKAKVLAHLNRYNKQGDRHYGLKGNLEMYGRKVVLLQVIKYMPKSPELATAVELDHTGGGRQNLADAKEVIAGTWATLPEDEEAAQPQPGALPTYDAAAFAKNLPKWRASIAKGKPAADVIAMIESKNTLTAEQRAAIEAPDLGDATEAELADLMERAKEATISEAEIAKHLGLAGDRFKALTKAQLARARAFVADPAGAA